MADYTELKQRAEELIEIERVAPCGSKRVMLVDPVAILALIAERERLSADEQEAADLCDCLSDLLRNTAIEVRGREEPLQRHGFHDLPSRVKTVVAERDQLKAEIAGFKTGYEAYEQVNAGLKAEVEALRLALETCADELEGQVVQCYHGQQVEDMHPVTRRSYDRDMACVTEARAAMSKGEQS